MMCNRQEDRGFSNNQSVEEKGGGGKGEETVTAKSLQLEYNEGVAAIACFSHRHGLEQEKRGAGGGEKED